MEYIFIFISLLSNSPGLRNTEYRHNAKPERWTEMAASHITKAFAQTMAATNDRLWLSLNSNHSFYSL
jgi:hypothetical protein